MIISLCATLLCLMDSTDHDTRKHIVVFAYDLYRLGYISADVYRTINEKYIDAEDEDT